MEQNPPTTERPLHISPVVWFLGIGLVIAVIAIFFFNVAVSSVAYYGFFAFMMGSHFFMHGSHAGHGGHENNPASNAVESNKDEQPKYTGGCH